MTPLVLVLALALAIPADAGQGSTAVGAPRVATVADTPLPFDGPPPPVPPDVIARDAAGRVTVRAVPVTSPIRIDGQLDEAAYTMVRSMSDFIQVDPQEGEPATQKTEVWLLFDDTHVYATARCWESQPERMVANDMRRDTPTIYQGNDNISFMFDTFYDRRNGVTFTVTPLGGRNDGQFANESVYNGDYNPIWEFKTGRFEGGWTVEIAVPFKSLRYRPGRAQVWGLHVTRNNFWKNEVTSLVPLPASRGRRGIMLSSMAATVVGLEVPAGSRNLEIKPYAISDLTTDLTSSPKISNDIGGDIGLDLKYGITQSLTADVTYNTDFAQVEADEQQVNLTRFSLFFPEKREFFLENQGMFSFGGIATSGPMAGAGDAPILFYSRRIGLEQGRAVPLVGGGRVTGRVGRFGVGALGIRSSDEPKASALATNLTVVRIKRDILRRSAIGLLYTGRSVGQNGRGRNDAYGVDGTFGFWTNVAVNAYWAKTRTDGLSGDDTSYRAQLDYIGDRYGLQLEQLMVGDNFNPEVGFVKRDDIRRSYGQFRFSPRPQSNRSIRKFSWIGNATYVEDGAGRVETRIWDGEFGIEFQNSDMFVLGYGQTYEFLPRPFEIAPAVTLPVGGYDYGSARTAFTFGQQRRLSGVVSLDHGTFYNGDKTTFSISGSRVQVSPQFSIQPSLSLNRVNLTEGAFTARLLGSRLTYTMTPLMFVSALLQYNSSSNSVATNVRLRWDYQPGSELFIVYNEQRDTLSRRFPDIENRALIVKVNRLFRF